MTTSFHAKTTFRVGDLVRYKHGRKVWRLARIHARGISGELWKGPTAWGARTAFFDGLELVDPMPMASVAYLRVSRTPEQVTEAEMAGILDSRLRLLR